MLERHRMFVITDIESIMTLLVLLLVEKDCVQWMTLSTWAAACQQRLI